jgi:hypothetical protein
MRQTSPKLKLKFRKEFDDPIQPDVVPYGAVARDARVNKDPAHRKSSKPLA